MWALIVLAIASLSKFLGSILGAQLSFLPLREGAALGVGLNARGALEIVIATVGLSLGVLNDRSYTVIVLMAMATSMAAPRCCVEPSPDGKAPQRNGSGSTWKPNSQATSSSGATAS